MRWGYGSFSFKQDQYWYLSICKREINNYYVYKGIEGFKATTPVDTSEIDIYL